MRIGQISAGLLLFLALAWGARSVEAQQFRAEVGGGWALPSSDVTTTGTLGGQEGQTTIDTKSGAHMYGAIGLVWTLSDNFDLEARLRVQQSNMDGEFENFNFSNQPDGRLRGLSFEGQITLTSVGRINPYFLVGLGAVRTTFDEVSGTDSSGREGQFTDVAVTDAGGDVGFGATMPLVGNLLLTAEIRAAGSLPGAKENAVTTFPFSLGLRYTFGRE
jgi:opacity protein-like surface antigen